MRYDLAVRGDLVLPTGVLKDGWIVVSSGRIAGILEASARPDAHRVLEASGKWVFPGAVDAHVHAFSNQACPEGYTNLTRAAAAGGVTTVIDMPYDAPHPT